VHSGANYFQNFNFTGNSCSAPKSLTQTDTLEFIAKLDLNIGAAYSGYAIGTIDNQSTSRQFYVFYSGGSFGLLYGNGLTQTATASTTTTRYNGWLRVTLEKSGSNSLVKFYKSDEFNITDKNLVNWTQIGSTITGTYAAMSTTSSICNILSGGLSSNATFAKCYYAQFSETIGGTPLSVFNPNQYNAANSQTQWTSSTGEVWTINTGTATTGYKGVLVDRTIVQGDGIDDGLQAPSLPALNTQTLTIYLAHRALAANGTVLELSNNFNLNARVFNTAISASRGMEFGTRESNYNVYSTPANTNFKLFSSRNNNGLTPGTAEIDIYYNNSIQSKTTVVSTDQTFTFNTNYPLSILARNGGGTSAPTNSVLTTAILTKTYDTTQLTSMYDYIKSINNNAF
jgi:hypothetical protein